VSDFHKSSIFRFLTQIWYLVLVASIIFLITAFQVSAQDSSSQATDQSIGTQSDQDTEKKEDEEKSAEDEEQKSGDEKQETKESSEEVKKDEQGSSEEQATEEEKTEERDLLTIFEEMKKSGPGAPIKEQAEQQPVKAKEKTKPPAITEQEDFVGPLLPSEEYPAKGEGNEFIGPTLPDIRLPPIEEETFFELEFEGIEPPEGRKFVDFSADKITRDKLKNLVNLDGNARMVYEDLTILSEFAEFNEDEEWGKFWGKDGVLADNEDGIMKCDTLEAFFKDKLAKAHGDIEIFVYGREYEDKLEEDAPRKERVKRALGQDDTTVFCDEGEYNWGEKIFHGWVVKSEKVKIIQEGRYAYAKAVYHEKETELTVLEGSVELWQKKGDWLFDRDVVKDKEDKWANALLRPETTITCDILESRGDEEITTLEGNVLAVQKEKKGSTDKVTFNDKDEIMVAEGNVKAHQNNGDWLILWKIVDPKNESEETLEDLKKPADGQSDKFTLWTEKKDFEADGNVKAWQEHQELDADKAIYKKETDRLFMQGNVKMFRKDKENSEKKDDLASESLIMWLTTKVYEAFGQVESIKKIDVEEERQKAKEEKEKKEKEKSESSSQGE